MDYADLEKKLKENAAFPAIISMNAGTTVKGAVDSVSKIRSCLANAGYTRSVTLCVCLCLVSVYVCVQFINTLHFQ